MKRLRLGVAVADCVAVALAVALLSFACGESGPASVGGGMSGTGPEPYVGSGTTTGAEDSTSDTNNGGCGDGIPVSGEYCFRFVALPPLGGDQMGNLYFAVDVDRDGVDEAAVRMRPTGGDSRLRIFAVRDGVPELTTEIPGFLGLRNGDTLFSSLDWDGDGLTDLSTMFTPSGTVFPYLRGPAGDFSSAPEVVFGEYGFGIPFVFNPTGRGRPSVLAGHNGGVQVYREDDGQWAAVGEEHQLANVCGTIHFAVEHDADGDGLLDVLALDHNLACNRYATTYDPERHRMAVFRGREDGTLGAPILYETGIPPALPILGIHDVDGDGREDVVLRHDWSASDTGYSILKGQAGGSFAAADVYVTALGPGVRALIRLGDFDGDGDVDGMFHDGETSEISIADDIRAPTPTVVGWDPASSFSAPGDFNGDGVCDFISRRSHPADLDPQGSVGLLLSDP